jgi:hypothetical protein
MSGTTKAELDVITAGELDMLERQYLHERVGNVRAHEFMADVSADMHDEDSKEPSDELLFRKLPALFAAARELATLKAEPAASKPAPPPTSNPDDFDLRTWNPGNHGTPGGIL